jgi:hypothetical protein
MAIAFFIFCDFFLQLERKIYCESWKTKAKRAFAIYREIELIYRFFYFYGRKQLKLKGYLIGPRNSKHGTILNFEQRTCIPTKRTSGFS